jgi:histidinol-phosphate/aromatic aminotransferase/cobyric acid decarboxylase-like protein
MTERDVNYVSSLYGGFWRFDAKDFCYMTNPYFPPEEFMESLQSRLKELVKSYPSTNWYISSLAAEPFGLSHEQLVIANGASELISVITDTFVDHLAIPVPTFDEFANRAAVQGKRVSPYPLGEDFELDVDGFIGHVRNVGANAVVLVRPNNPVGTLVPSDSVRHILESLRHLDLVLIDESFVDFVGEHPAPSSDGMMAEFPNLVIMKSLSKIYGIPGLRLGYASSGNPDMVAELRKQIPIWSINSLAQYFLEEIGQYQQEYIESCRKVVRATRVLSGALHGIPIQHT